MTQYINRYEKFFLVFNLTRYLKMKSLIESENKEESNIYGKINESEPTINFSVLAEEQIERELLQGIDVKEKYGVKFLENFVLPGVLMKEEGEKDD